jgi:hypothetical protein
MTATRSKTLLTLLAAVLLAIATLTFARLDSWNPVSQVDAAIDTNIADQFTRNYGFRVDITPGPPSDVLAQWDSIAGGGFVIQATELVAGRDLQSDGGGGLIVVQELLLTGELNAGGALTTAAPLPETVDPGVAYAAAVARSRIFTNEFDTDLSENVTSVEISSLIIPALASSVANAQWRLFAPGAPQPVVVTFDLIVHPDDQIVQDWWNDTADGMESRKNIVVNARQSPADSPAWSPTLVNCAIIDTPHGAPGSTPLGGRAQLSPRSSLRDANEWRSATAAATSSKRCWTCCRLADPMPTEISRSSWSIEMGPMSTPRTTTTPSSRDTNSLSSTQPKMTSRRWIQSSSKPTRLFCPKAHENTNSS